MLERLIRRDRALMSFGLAAITLLAWMYLVRETAAMSAMAADARMHAAMGMADMRRWGASDWFGLFVMWADDDGGDDAAVGRADDPARARRLSPAR